ncbi:MAG: transglutaminase-like domain-containing protein [Bacteroidales bacterium]
MRHLVRVAAFACLLAAAAVAHAQSTPDEQALAAKAREFSRLYAAKSYDAAAQAADETIALARKMNRADVVGGMLYNKACLAAVTGHSAEAIALAQAAVEAGYTDYYMFASDADFASIRGSREFTALLADLRKKNAVAPHDWDPTRSTGPFSITFDDPSLPALVELRREFDIDRAVSGAHDDYARLLLLTSWVSKQWQHSPTGMASKADPTTILREAKAGGHFICRDYAIVLAGAARAYGMPARVLNLLPRDVETRSEAHSVAEVWVASRTKWVLADGQYGIVAEVAGVPANGVELQRALASDDARVTCAVGGDACSAWKPFVLRNGYYFKTAQDQRRYDGKRGPQLVLVPKGAPDPHKFAGGNEEVFAGAVYISDPKVFYTPPMQQ